MESLYTLYILHIDDTRADKTFVLASILKRVENYQKKYKTLNLKENVALEM